MNELYYDNLKRSFFYWSVGIFDFRSFHGTPKWVFQSCFLYVFLNTGKKSFSASFLLQFTYSAYFQFLSCHLWRFHDKNATYLYANFRIFISNFTNLSSQFLQISTLRSIVFSALIELKQRQRNFEKKFFKFKGTINQCFFKRKL